MKRHFINAKGVVASSPVGVDRAAPGRDPGPGRSALVTSRLLRRRTV